MGIHKVLAILICGVFGGQVQGAAQDVRMAADRLFAQMPDVAFVSNTFGRCGAGAGVNEMAVYCTTQNRIFVRADLQGQAGTAYLIAHLYGHAVQVRHGVADVALRTIQADRANEVALRAFVAQQVDCIAGYIYQAAGLPMADLTAWFDGDPFADIHWGRDPLTRGPVMGIGVSARNAWFARGQAGDLSACAAGPFGADLLLAARENR